jgi:hypothetical protein
VKVFVDANIPMYVAGRDHPFKEPSADFLRRVARGEIEAASDVEVLQEILYRYFHTREVQAGFAVFEAFLQTIPLFYPVLLQDTLRAKELLRKYAAIEPRDAIHAAIMLRSGVETIVSYDRHFDQVAEIRRIEP